MKRRNFLKWLPTIPLGVKALRDAPKEEPKPDPPKPVEVVRDRQVQVVRLDDLNRTNSSFTVILPVDWKP